MIAVGVKIMSGYATEWSPNTSVQEPTDSATGSPRYRGQARPSGFPDLNEELRANQNPTTIGKGCKLILLRVKGCHKEVFVWNLSYNTMELSDKEMVLDLTHVCTCMHILYWVYIILEFKTCPKFF